MLRPIHFEIHADDPARASAFYTQVFGWEFKKWDHEGVDYWMIVTGPKEAMGINGGMLKRPAALGKEMAGPNAYVCTMDVPSVDEHLTKITSAGGSIAAPKMAIPGMAWLAYCKDTEGNVFGIFQEDKNAK